MASIYDPFREAAQRGPVAVDDPFQQPAQTVPGPAERAQLDPYFSRGLRSALAGGIGGAAKYIGAEFDAPGFERWGEEKERRAAELAPPGLDLDEVKDIPSALRFGTGMAGVAIGGTLPTLATGIGGALAGIRLASKIGAGAKASRIIGATGAYGGAYGAAYPMEAGESFSSLEEAGISRDTALAQARKKALVNAGLEAAIPTIAMNPLARFVLGRRRIVTAMAGEAATEAAQEYSGQFFRAEVDPSFRMDDPARGKERVTAAIAGAMGGGALTLPALAVDQLRGVRDITGEAAEVGKRLVDRFKKSTAGEVTADAVTNMALQADQLMEQAKASATPEAAEQLMEQAKALGIATQAGIGEWIERVRANPRSQGTADMQVLSSMLAERGISRESAREVMKSGLGYLRETAADGREYARGLLTAASSPEFVEASGTIETDARKDEIRDWLRGAGDALVPPEISADLQTTVEYLKTTAPQVKAAQASAWFRELDDDLQARVLQGIGKNFINPKLQSRVAFASRVQELRDDDTRLTAIADRVMEGIKGKNLSLEPTQRDVTFAQKLRRAIQSNRRIDLQSEDAQRHIEHIIDNVVAISRSPAYQYWNVNKEASGPTAGIAELDGLSRAEITRILDRVLPTDISPDLALLLKRFGLIETGLKEFAQPEALEVTTKIVAKYMQQAGTTELIEPRLRTLRNGTTIDDGQTALETISRTVMRIALDHGYSVTSSRAEMERTLRNLSVAFNGDTAIMEAAVTETAQALEAQLPYGIAGEAITEVMAGQELEIGRQAAATAGQYTREEQVALGLEDEDAQATAPSLPEGWQVQAVAKPRIYHPPSTWVDISSPQARQNADAYLADVVQQLEHELGGPWTPQGDNDVHPVSFVSLPSYALTKAGNSLRFRLFVAERPYDKSPLEKTVEAKYDATIQELIDSIKKANLDPGASLPAALQGNETFEAMRKGVRKQVDFLAKVRDADLKTKFEFLKQYAVVQAELVNPEAEVFSKKQRDYMQSIKSNDDFIPITLPSERLRTVEGKTVKPGFGIMRINPMRVTFAVFSDKNLSDQLPQADSDVARAYFAFTKGLGMLMVQMPVQNDMALFGFPADKPIPEIKTFTKLEFNFDEAEFAKQKGLQGFLNLISPEGGGQPTPGWYRSPQADILVSPGFVRVVDKTVVKGGKKSRGQKFIREYTTVRPDLRIYARQGEVFRFAQAKIAANDVQRIGAPGIGTQIAEDALAQATDAFYERQILSSVQYESETSYEGATAEMEVARNQLLTLERSTLVELSNTALRADQLIEQAKASATPEAAEKLMKQAKELGTTAQIVDRTLKGVVAALTKIESGIEALNEDVNIFSDRAQYAQGEWTSPETRPTPGTEEAAGEVFEIAVQERKRRNRAVRRFEEDLSLFSAGQKSPMVGSEGRFRRSANSFDMEEALLRRSIERDRRDYAKLAKNNPVRKQLAEGAKAKLARIEDIKNFRDRATEPVEHRPGTVFETKKERTTAVTNLKKRLERAQKEVVTLKNPDDERKATSRIAAMKLELRDAENAVIVKRRRLAIASRGAVQPQVVTGEISGERYVGTERAGIAKRAAPKLAPEAQRSQRGERPLARPPLSVLPQRQTTALFSVVAGKIADLTGMSVEDARIAAQYTQPLAARYGLTQIQDDRDAGKITPEQATLQTTAYLGKRGLRFDKKQWDENKVIKLAIANRALGVPFAVGERRQLAPSTRGLKQPEVKPVAKRIQRVATPAPEVVQAAPKPTRFAESPENFIAAKKAINARLKALQAERKEKGGKREATPVEELFRTLAELNYGKLNKQQRTVYAAMGTALSRPDLDAAFKAFVTRSAGSANESLSDIPSELLAKYRTDFEQSDLAAIIEAGTKSGVLTTHAKAVSANAPKRAGTTRHFYYAGVGSRETPSKVLRQMTQLSEQLEKAGFHLRSGNAMGADQAFETGVTDEASKTSYLSRHATPEAIKFASKLHPAWPAVLAAGKGIDKLLGRNVFQVLGKDFTDASNASDFVVYYDNPLERGGGTKMAVAIAEAKNIPAFNLFYGDPAVEALRTWLVKNYPANLKKKGVGGALTGVMPKGHAIPVSDLNRPAVKPPTDAEIAAARARAHAHALLVAPKAVPILERTLPVVPMRYRVPPAAVRQGLRTRYPKGTSTAQMVADGVRTATTRNPFGKVGTRFRVQDAPGVYEITAIQKVDFRTPAGRNAWAQLEGWDPAFVQKNLSRQVYTGATQTVFKRIDEQGPKPQPRKSKPVAQELASSPTAAISLEAEPRTDLDGTEAATLDDLIKQQKNFNLEPPKKGRRKKLAPTQKEVVDLAKKLLDKDITVEWMNTDWEIVIDGKKYKPSGQFAEVNGREILRVSATAKDPLLKVHHEAMHGLLLRMMKDPDTRPVVEKLVKAVSTPQVLKQLRGVLPAEARAQLGDPLERVAYAYQYWTVNKVAFGPTAKNLFQTIADLLRRLVRAMANHEVAEVVFDAFNKGELASKELLAMRLRAKLTRSYVDKAGEILKPLVGVYEKLIATSDARMRATGVLALAELADMFKPEVGSQNKQLGFIQKKFAVGNQWLNEFADILTGTSEEDRLKAAELLHAQADNAGPLGNKVREFLDKAFDYIEASGVERYFGWNKKGNVAEWGKVQKRAKFFPMVFDKEAVYKDHEPFVKMLVDNNVNRRKAEEIWTAISRKTAIVGVEDGEFGNLNEDGVAYTPLFSSLEPRTLNQLHKDPRFLKYADKDLMGVMSRYIHQMVARAEYTKRFGNEGRGILDKLDEAKKQGATPEQIAAAMNYVRAMEGTYGREQDPELRKWTSTLIVYQNVRLLGMALFSSFVDPLGLWVRGASFTEATKAFIKGISDVFRSQDSIIKEHSNEIAELVGTIDRTSMLESMGQMYGSNYLSPWQRKVNDFMFWVNGMNAWNTSMRTSATFSAMKFIKLHAERAKTGDDTSIRYLNELNLKPQDVKLAADGEVDVRDEKIQEAIHLWVDDAVLRPTAADRPIWASDPVFAIFFHLKQYIYSFQKHIMGRAFLEAQNGNLIPVAALGAYIPVMLASDITRGLIQGLGDQPSYRQGWTAGDWLSNSIQRSGLTGISQFAIDTATDLDYGGLGYESILGPSVSQFTKGVNVVLGEGNAGSFAVAALPGSSWYKNW